MPTEFLHGAEVILINSGVRPYRTIKSSVVGIIGTAPDADGDVFPLNQPVLIANERYKLTQLGNAGSLPSALNAIFYQTGATIIVVRVTEGANIAETMSNIIGQPGPFTGVNAFLRAREVLGYRPRLLLAPDYMAHRPTDGVASVNVTAGGAGYTSAPTVTITGDGVGATGRAIVQNGSVTAVVIDNPGLGYTNAAITFTGGGGADAAATAVLGAAKNPVTAALLGIAEQLNAHVYADGPVTDYAAALQWRQDFDSRRLSVWAPAVQQWDVNQNVYVQAPASPAIVGSQVWLDHNRGFWYSPSNQPLNQIGGTSRPVGFTFGDKDAEANLLNEQNINTIVRQDGWRSWGNHTCSSDEMWRFTSVSRTADIIHDSLIEAALTWMDRPLNEHMLLQNIVESGRTYLRYLTSLGALVGGNMWIDEEFNDKTQLQAGKLTISMDIEPPAPLEHLIYRSHRNADYYESLITQVQIDLNQLAA